MTFKLPSLKGKSNADKSLVSHGLPLFQWGDLQEKEEPIGRGSFGLVFVARNGHGEKVVIKKLLSEDNQEKCLFIKEAKILHGIDSEHIVKFKAACMEPCAIMLGYLFFDVPSDWTNGCAFMSVIFGDLLLRSQPSASSTTLPALLKKSSLIPLFNSTLFVK